MKSNSHAVFYGWWIVFTAALGLFWGVPVTVYTFSVFAKTFIQDFHATRTAVSFAFTLQNIVAAVSAPMAGWLVGRSGARRIILVSLSTFGVILIFNKSLSGGIWQLYLLYAAFGVLINGIGPIPYAEAISHWFDRQRGLAIGIMMAGIGCGAVIMPSLTQRLITNVGWRSAFAMLGCAILLIPIPVLAAFFRERPQEMGLLPDGTQFSNVKIQAEFNVPGISLRDARRTRAFWLILCALFLTGASVQGCLVHLTPMLIDSGASAGAAALGSSVMGSGVLIGRVGTGYLLDRFFAPRVAALLFSAAAFGIGIIGFGSGDRIVFAGAFLIGLALGAEVDVIAYLISRYFGLRFFGQVYSVAFGAFVLAGALGPLAMAAGFDFTGSYHFPLAILFIATVIASLLMNALEPYRYPVRRPEQSTSIGLLPTEAKRLLE